MGRAFPGAADPSLDDCPCPLLLRWAAGPPGARPPAWTWWGNTGQATPGPLGTAHHGSPRPPFCISSPRPTSHWRGVCPWLPPAAGSALRAGVHPGASHRPTADRAFQPPPSPVPNAATDPATAPAPLPYPPRSTSPPAPSPSTIPATCQHHRAGPHPPPPRLRHRREPETQGCATPRRRAGGVRASGPSGTPLPRGGGAVARAAGQRPSARASAAAGQGQRAARAEPQPARSGEAAALLAQRGAGAGAVGAAAPRGGGPRCRRGAGGAAIGGEGACRSGRGGPGWGRQAGRARGLRRAKARETGLMEEEGGLAAGGGCGRSREGWRGGSGEGRGNGAKLGDGWAR